MTSKERSDNILSRQENSRIDSPKIVSPQQVNMQQPEQQPPERLQAQHRHDLDSSPPLDLWLEKAKTDRAFSDFLSAISRSKNDEGISIPAHKAVNLIGPSDPQKSYLQALVYEEERSPFWVLVADELRARLAAQELRAFLGNGVFVFSSRDLHLLDAKAASRDQERRRLAILQRIRSGDYKALVVSAASLLNKLPSPEVYGKAEIELAQGDIIAPEELSKRLAAAGYEKAKLADQSGQFARHGDVIDIIITSAAAELPPIGLRVSFFDIEIDDLRLIDLETQRSTGTVKSFVIPPARELILEENRIDQLAAEIRDAGEEAARSALQQGGSRSDYERLRLLGSRDAERLQGQIPFAALDRWLPLIYPDSACIFDYASPATRFWLDEMAKFSKLLDAEHASWIQELAANIENSHALPLTEAARGNPSTVRRRIDQRGSFISMAQIDSAGNGLPGAKKLKLGGRVQDHYKGREENLYIDLASWRDAGHETALFAGSASRREQLDKRLRQHNLYHAFASQETLIQGFFWPEGRISVLGSQDLFGIDKPARRRKYGGGQVISLFSDLEPGELVVHEDHGIAKYRNLKKIRSSSGERDYLHLQYADGDLYIPVDALDQIRKYISTDERKPRLSKLGGTEWERQKTKARESIKRLATDLVALYAKRRQIKGYAFSPDTVWQREFEEAFPFEETEDQLRVIAEIKHDMEEPHVMERLLCGDVGFGKTEVCFRALFKCIMDNKQAALLAPTTVLTQQHYNKLCERMGDLPANIRMLSRFVPEQEQKKTLEDLRKGKVDIIIGTHRLLSQDVVFSDLGLLVIDEEQRFGVDHKELIKERYPALDVLSLTATPIPRTLHMSLSGIRDISLLEEGPEDRRPIQTYVMEYDENVAVEAILRETGRGGQSFYLFNNTYKIEDRAAGLRELLPGVRIVTAHGKMSEHHLEQVISDFIAGDYDVLVCTTIIESGIDMPNVNTIVVENADRLGMAQLYQIRGRVGRSERQAYAYITYPQDKVLTETAEKRLVAIRDYTELGSGFKIALRDLEVRGAGNLLGAEQSGNLGAVGYDLYCKMMDEAVKVLTGVEPEPAPAHALVELEVDAFLSERYIRDNGQRIDMYRRIAELETAACYRDVLDELTDRYGDLPVEALTLCDIAYIRSFAGRAGFSRVSVRGHDVIFSFTEDGRSDMDLVSRIMAVEKEKNHLQFQAGHKPQIIFQQAARAHKDTAARIRQLFLAAEEKAATKAS